MGTSHAVAGFSSSLAMLTPSVIVLAYCRRSVPCTASHEVYSPPSAVISLSGSLTASASTFTFRCSSSAGARASTSALPSPS